jgi:hypothetical protein
MLRLLLPTLSLLMVLCQSSTYASSQQAKNVRLDPLLERVGVSLQAHLALVEQLHLDQETLLVLGSAAGDDLQPIFVATSNNYRHSVEAAVSVSSAIAGMNQTAITLFEEWRDEIGYLTDARLKEELTQSLQQSEAMIDPVLAELRKFLTYFKYALDEASIASRKTELSDTDNNIEALINALTASAVKSKAFLESTQ